MIPLMIGSCASFVRDQGPKLYIAATKDRFVRAPCWSPQLAIFCAISNGVGGNANQYSFITSPDGVNWTTRHLANSTSAFFSLAWSPVLGIFCAVGVESSGQPYLTYATSEDGVTWTEGVTAHGSIGSTGEVMWAGPVETFFTALGGGGNIFLSPAGTTWTRQYPGNYYVDRVEYVNHLDMFIAAGGANLLTSLNGANWTVTSAPVDGVQDIAYGNGVIIVTGVSGSAYSYDGVVWQEWTSAPTPGITRLIFVPQKNSFVAMRSFQLDNEGVLYFSEDGFNWTQTTSDLGVSGTYFADITFSPALNKLCVVGTNANSSVGRILLADWN